MLSVLCVSAIECDEVETVRWGVVEESAPEVPDMPDIWPMPTTFPGRPAGVYSRGADLEFTGWSSDNRSERLSIESVGLEVALAKGLGFSAAKSSLKTFGLEELDGVLRGRWCGCDCDSAER